jgi:ABC-type xylose transport system permease subunit
MQRIQRIGVISLAKIQGLLFLLFGLLFGLLYGVIVSIVGIVAAATGEKEALILVIAGVACIIGFPLLYGGMGFVMGALMAWLYNLVARRFGGLEIDLEFAPAPSAAAPPPAVPQPAP